MKNLLKKILCFAGAALFAFSGIACDGNDVGGGSIGVDTGAEIKLFINNGHYYDGTKKDNIWLEIEKQANVKFSVTGESHSGSYYTKLSPMVNTIVDSPDLIFLVPTSESLGTSTFSDVWCAPKTGLMYSYEEMLEGYPEGTYPYLEKILFESQYKNITQNEKHYLLPNFSSANSWGIYYRKDWLIAAGYFTVDAGGNKVARYPVNMDEFTDVLAKFSNINAIAKEQGITLKQTAEKTYGFSPAQGPHFWMPIYHAFGVTPDWDIYGNEVDYMYTNAKFRNFLVWANEMYSKKYIYPTFNSLASNGERQLFYDGQIGVMFTNAESHVQYIMNRMTSLGLGEEVGMGPALEGTETYGEVGSKGFSDWGGYWGGFCIPKACKNITGALNLLNFLYSPKGSMLRNHGIEGTHYMLENGEVVLTEECIENRLMEGDVFINFEVNGEQLPIGKYEMGTSFGLAVDWSSFDETSKLYAIQRAEDIDRVYTSMVQDALDNMVLKSSKLVNFTAFPSATSSAMLSYADKAKSYVNSTIMGLSGYSISEWDKLISDLKGANKNKVMFTSATDVCRQFGFID